jgi:hypothetical protein
VGLETRETRIRSAAPIQPPEQPLRIGELEQRVQETGVPPEELGTLHETLLQVRVEGLEPPDQERALQVLEVSVHGL